MSKNEINQTNRTILFEEINSEKLDLLTLIDEIGNFESLEDEKIKEINNHLLVKSFDEFLEKFEPKIYSYYDANSKNIMYLLEKPEGIPQEFITEISIDKGNTFFKMLNTLIDSRKSQGNKNVDFKFENILELISPKKVMEDIKQIRKEIAYTFSKYEELDDNNPKKLELGDKLNQKFEEASYNYNNVLGMLPLAIEDIKTRLLIENDNSTLATDKIKLGMLQIGDKGELEVIEYKQEVSSDLVLIEEKNSTEIVEAFKYDYESVTEQSNAYMKDLIVRTFVPLAKGIVDVDLEQEIQNYNNYLEFYKIAQENFIKVAKPLVEKILGIKMFFEQYDAKIAMMQPALLITNIKADMLIRGENKEKLKAYLNTVNSKNDFENTVWLGIYPNVDLDVKKSSGKIRERFKGSQNNGVEKNKNNIETLSNLMTVLGSYKIQLFFNFEGNSETTFDDVATKGIEKYLEKTKILENQRYSEYLVPVIPNFTIIPKDKSGVILDAKMKYENEVVKLSKEKEDLLQFWIEGVYIDGSYIAAGIIASIQCPSYLKERFANTSPNYPGVRFDIEAEDNAYKVKTTMAKEISGYTNSLKDKINQFNGFIFSSDSVQVNKEKIKNITVYKARTLSRNDEGMYESVYKTLTTTYIERILRYATMDFKEDKLNNFFSTNPLSQKSIWLKDRKFVNSIMQKGDDISHMIDEENGICQLNITFAGNMKNLQVEISKN